MGGLFFKDRVQHRCTYQFGKEIHESLAMAVLYIASDNPFANDDFPHELIYMHRDRERVCLKL